MLHPFLKSWVEIFICEIRIYEHSKSCSSLSWSSWSSSSSSWTGQCVKQWNSGTVEQSNSTAAAAFSDLLEPRMQTSEGEEIIIFLSPYFWPSSGHSCLNEKWEFHYFALKINLTLFDQHFPKNWILFPPLWILKYIGDVWGSVAYVGGFFLWFLVVVDGFKAVFSGF